jgi:signal transduction histidine kinase
MALGKWPANMNTMHSLLVDDDAACIDRVHMERMIEQLNSELRSKVGGLRQRPEFESSRQTNFGNAHVSDKLLKVIDDLLQLAAEQIDPRQHARHPQSHPDTQISHGIYCPKLIESQFTAVVEIVERLVRQMQPLFGSRILIKVGYVDPLAVILADRGLLRQALMNLCASARDAMLSDGVISIDAKTVSPSAVETSCLARASHHLPSGRYVSIRVSDMGYSIPQNLRERIFSPFLAITKVGNATALCLSTVHAIAKQHGGWIVFESEYSVGTSVVVNLPLVDVSPPVPMMEPTENSPALEYVDAKACLNCGCIDRNANGVGTKLAVGRLAP